MLKHPFSVALCALAPFATAAEPDMQQLHRAGSQASRAGAAPHFSGPVSVQPLFSTSPAMPVSAAYVTFEPGARSAWHSHPAGQRLVVVAGTGLTQQWGQPVQQLHPGDVVECPPGVKHWHGAAATGPMTHLAVTGVVDGKSVAWMEPVDEPDQASQAPAPTPAATPLSARQQAIPLIGAAMAKSDLPALDQALRQGLDAGLSVSEVREILVQLYAYAGFPRSLNALGELMKLLSERERQGIVDPPGREPTRPVPTGDALLAVGKANQTRISGRPVQGPLFDFAPVINQYLQAHLFGDIFERDNLDWQSRELATLGALAAVPGLEAQLRSHMAASLRVGLTPAQLRQVVWLLAGQGDKAGAQRAGQALDAQFPTTNPGR